MKTYKIFANPQGTHEGVKEGWSWPAFFFTWIWALFKKMWLLGIGVGILVSLIGLVGAGASFDAETLAGMGAFNIVMGLIVSVIFGVNGNKWRGKKLRARGYETQGSLDSRNPEAAIASWLKDGGQNST